MMVLYSSSFDSSCGLVLMFTKDKQLYCRFYPVSDLFDTMKSELAEWIPDARACNLRIMSEEEFLKFPIKPYIP